MTDVAEMKVASRTVTPRKGTTAAAKGALGYALAVLFIRDAEKVADQEEKRQESAKSRLSQLTKLDRDSHIEFRKGLDERVQMMKDTAAVLEMSLTNYLRTSPRDNSVYATCSLWNKLSMACETGWSPDLSQRFAQISMEATEKLAAKAAPTGPAADGAVTTQTANPTARRGRTALSLLDKVKALMKDQPLQEIEKARDLLTNMIEQAKAKQGKPVNTAEGAPRPTNGTSAPASVHPMRRATDPQPEQQKELIAADAGERRTRNRDK